MRLFAFPSQQISLPPLCACCSRPTAEQTSLQYDETYHFGVAVANIAHVVKVPYCSACENHAIWYRDFGVAGVIGWVLGMSIVAVPLAAFACGFGLIAAAAGLEALGVSHARVMQWAWPAWTSAVGAVVAGVAYLVWRRRTKRRPPSPLGPEHASRRFAAALVGAPANSVVLVFLSEPYADAIARHAPWAKAVEAPQGFGARPDATPAWHVAALLLMIALGVAAYLGWLR